MLSNAKQISTSPRPLADLETTPLALHLATRLSPACPARGMQVIAAGLTLGLDILQRALMPDGEEGLRPLPPTEPPHQCTDAMRADTEYLQTPLTRARTSILHWAGDAVAIEALYDRLVSTDILAVDGEVRRVPTPAELSSTTCQWVRRDEVPGFVDFLRRRMAMPGGRVSVEDLEDKFCAKRAQARRRTGMPLSPQRLMAVLRVACVIDAAGAVLDCDLAHSRIVAMVSSHTGGRIVLTQAHAATLRTLLREQPVVDAEQIIAAFATARPL